MANTTDNKKLKWEEVAEKMHLKSTVCQKSGKQCRERWHNHLAPELNNSGEWKEEEDLTLFKYHGELGNKWAKIATFLPGRTDNCVKNHFYSTLRRGMRKVNNFIHESRKKKSPIKEFKPDVLTKILIVADGDPEQKLTTKKNANTLSQSIKENLIKVSLKEEDNTCHEETLDKIIELIMEFNKSCKKRKGKKKGPITDRALSNKHDESENEEESMSDSEVLVKEKPIDTKLAHNLNKHEKMNQKNSQQNEGRESSKGENDEPKLVEHPVHSTIVGKEENDMWNNLGGARKVSRAASVEGYFPAQEVLKSFGVNFGPFYGTNRMEECNTENNLFNSSGTNFVFAPIDGSLAQEIFADSGIGLGNKRNENINFFNMSGTDEKHSFLNFNGDKGVLELDDLAKSGEYEFGKGQVDSSRLRNSNNSSAVLSNSFSNNGGSVFEKLSNSMFKAVSPPEDNNTKFFKEDNLEQ